MTDEPLSAQQIHGMQTRFAEVLKDRLEKMEVRQKCLELAVEALPDATPEDIMRLAKNMYEFWTWPATEVRVTIEGPV